MGPPPPLPPRHGLGRLMALAIVFLIYTFSWRTKHHITPENICMLVNTEDFHLADFTAAQWPGIPFWFAIWGQDVDPDELARRTTPMQHFIDGRGTNHAEGWVKLVEAVRRDRDDCEYFFFVDDDLTWTIDEPLQPQFPGMTTSEVLAAILDEYRPAVAVFPWHLAENTYDGQIRMSEMFAGKAVQPAIIFDNGCIAFHKSVIDFFVPMWLGPDLKAAYNTQWMYLNFIIPWLFRGHALQINALWYDNPAKEIRHGYTKDVIITNHTTRMNKNIKCTKMYWPPEPIGPEKVTWYVWKGAGSYCLNMLEFVSSFYNVADPLISGHPHLISLYSASSGGVGLEQRAKDIERRMSKFDTAELCMRQPDYDEWCEV